MHARQAQDTTSALAPRPCEVGALTFLFHVRFPGIQRVTPQVMNLVHQNVDPVSDIRAPESISLLMFIPGACAERHFQSALCQPPSLTYTAWKGVTVSLWRGDLNQFSVWDLR